MKRITKLLLITVLAIGLVAGLSCVVSFAGTTSEDFGYKATISVGGGDASSLGKFNFSSLNTNDEVTLTITTTQKSLNGNYRKIFGIQYSAYIKGMVPKSGTHDFEVSAKNKINNKPTLSCNSWVEYNFNGYLMNFVWMDTTKEKMENIPNPMTIKYTFKVTNPATAKISLDTALVLPEGCEAAETIKEEVTYTAPTQYAIKNGGVKNGILKIDNGQSKEVSVEKGQSVSFEIIPNDGYKVSTITVNNDKFSAEELVDNYSGGSIEYEINPVFNNYTISAECVYTGYIVNASVGANGHLNITGEKTDTISDQQTKQYDIAKGKTLKVTFVPDTGYKVSTVSVKRNGTNETVDNTVSSYTFNSDTVGYDNAIAVTFVKEDAEVAYTVNVTAGENGTVTPNGEVSVYEGENQSFIFTPNSGYKISDVKVDGVSKGNISSYEYPTGTTGSGHTINVTFEAATTGGGGTGGGGNGGSGTGDSGGGGNSGGSGGSGSGGDSGGSGDSGSGGDSGDSGGSDSGGTSGKGTVYNLCPRDNSCPIDPFYDADNNGWYHDGVHYCIDNGLMNGVGNGMFSPNGTTTRAMIVTILYRLAGSPSVYANSGFYDVEAGSWYANAVAWGQQNGVVTGYNATTFGPNDYITREQLGTILYRYSKLKGYDTSKTNNLSGFEDVNDVSAWALDGMKWANGSGIITGRTASTLVPLATATRAEAATMLQRYCVTIVK